MPAWRQGLYVAPAMRTIETAADVADGVRFLAAADPRLAAIAQRTGLPPLRRAPAGLGGLLRIVVDQQISLAASAAIWRRFEAQFSPFDANRLAAADSAALAATGLSAAKSRTVRAVGEAVASGGLDLGRLSGLADEEAAGALTAVSGIGPWTADIYLLTCLGRSDVWPVGDVALRAAAAASFGLARRPTPTEMIGLAEAWRPWRAVAARLLWAHYRELNGRSAAPAHPPAPSQAGGDRYSSAHPIGRWRVKSAGRPKKTS